VAGLDDVTITSLADNEILQYDSAADKWKNEALAAGSNEKIKVSATDTTAGYLETKLLSGTGISLTKGSGGGNETLTVASTVSGLVDSGCSVYANADITGITESEQAVILNTELFDKNTNSDKVDSLKFSLAEKKELLVNLNKREIELEKISYANELEIEKQKTLIERISKMDTCPLCKSKND